MSFLNIAADPLRLAALIGLGPLFMLGLGWLAVGPALHGSLTAKEPDTDLLQEIPLMLLAGLVVNYGAILILQSLRIAALISGLASLVGLGFLAASLWRHRHSWTWTAAGWAKAIGAALLWLVLLAPILGERLEAWDARSIWFFHAKMIYTAGSIGESAGWQEPNVVAISHVDYPKMVPALAAQAAHAMGLWNEYLPKAALLWLLLPALLWLLTFARASWSFLALLLMLPFGLSSSSGTATLWNGYMDAYLALYFGIAVLLLGRYLKSSRAVDLASAGCILLALPNLKNEGVLAALAGLPPLGYLIFRSVGFRFATLASARHLRFYLAALAGLFPAVLWSSYSRHWGLTNDLEVGTTQSVTRIVSRLLDGSYAIILARLWATSRGAWLLVGMLAGAYLAWKESLPRQILPAALAGGSYCLGILVIYLLTPYSVIWQLDTSMDRVVLSVSACLYAASYFLLDQLETRQKAGNIRAKPD